jgi:hypothetical protein
VSIVIEVLIHFKAQARTHWKSKIVIPAPDTARAPKASQIDCIEESLARRLRSEKSRKNLSLL